MAEAGDLNSLQCQFESDRGYVLEDTLLDDASCGLRWSAEVIDAASGESLGSMNAQRVLSTASIGKVLLLLAVAQRFDEGTLPPHTRLRRGDERVADSGLWQYLDAPTLTVADACRLVGAVSDNLATNVLIDAVGLAAVAEVAASLGLRDTMLCDRVRDERTRADAPTLSQGSAHELAGLAAAIHRGDAVGPDASSLVRGWLRLGTDLSMVAGAFGLDPLAHTEPDRGARLWNKTGTDRTVRGDVGVVETQIGAVAYAVLAEWDGTDAPRDAILAAMRDVGGVISRYLFVRP